MIIAARPRRGFSLIELLTVVALIICVLALTVEPDSDSRAGNPFSSARRTARRMQNSTQIRGIHMSMVVYAASNGDSYPGIRGYFNNSKEADITDATVAGRLKFLLDNAYFTPDYLIAPQETDAKPWTSGPFDESSYSYALPDIRTPGERQGEWRSTTNDDAPAICDRNTGDIARSNYGSVHGGVGVTPMSWQGSIGWNDNHVTFENSAMAMVRMSPQKAVTSSVPTPDDLFVGAGPDDALMIFSDSGKVVPSRGSADSGSSALIIGAVLFAALVLAGVIAWDRRKRRQRVAMAAE